MPQPKGGLGRGLNALIPTQPAAPAAHVEMIDLDQIEPNPHQPRHTMQPEALQELAESIRQHGIIQPLIVTSGPAGAPYRLIAGERRWTAARLAGLTQAPAIIKEATPQQMLELALVENIQRADLSPLEEADAYRHLIDDFALTQEQVAEKVGKSRVTVANSVRLLRLPAQIKEALAAGKISEGHARALLALENEALQVNALGLVLGKALSVRQTEELVRRLVEAGQTSPRAKAPDMEDSRSQALESEFESALNTRVKLFRSRRGGKLVIHFYSEEELQALYDAIVSRR